VLLRASPDSQLWSNFVQPCRKLPVVGADSIGQDTTLRGRLPHSSLRCSRNPHGDYSVLVELRVGIASRQMVTVTSLRHCQIAASSSIFLSWASSPIALSRIRV
jgi:hypothetical protein